MAVVVEATVDQAGDVRMGKTREDAAFARETRLRFAVEFLAAHELEGDGLLERCVGTLGEVDHAHAARAEQGSEAVGADAPANQFLDRIIDLKLQISGKCSERTVENAAELRIAAQEFAEFCRGLRRIGTGRVDPLLARGLRLAEYLVQQGCDVAVQKNYPVMSR